MVCARTLSTAFATSFGRLKVGMTTDTIGGVSCEVVGVIEVASTVEDPGYTGAKSRQV